MSEPLWEMVQVGIEGSEKRKVEVDIACKNQKTHRMTIPQEDPEKCSGERGIGITEKLSGGYFCIFRTGLLGSNRNGSETGGKEAEHNF